MLICCLETMMFPFSTRAESGYVGDEFGLDRPSVFVAYPYKVLEIQNVSWDYDYSCFSCYQTSGGLHVRITKYFETSKTITCEVRYKWGTSDGKKYWTSTERKLYSISCNQVDIDVSDMTMKVGQTQRLNYYASPKSPDITFISNNSSVASVNSYGEVTAYQVGTATITLKQNMGPDATCTVNVKEPVAPTSISLPSTRSVDVYSSITLSVTLQPADANPTLSWSSDNSSIATVDQNGKVTGVSPGKTKITATADNGLSASCEVTVTDVDRTPKTFEIAEEFSKKTVYVGEFWKLDYTITPSYANYTLNWASSDESVAKVTAAGYVQALKQGTARITGTIDGFSLTDYCDVIVKGTPNVFTIWLKDGQQMDIKLDKNIKVSYEGDKFIIKSEEMNVEYEASDVKMYTLENDGTVETGIETVRPKDRQGTMSFDGNTIRLMGFTPHSILRIYALGGQTEGVYRIDADGNLTLYTDDLNKGIHIIKTESITYKIITK